MGACERRCKGPRGEVWYCVDCCLHFCERCWDQFPPHMGDRRGRDGMKHEKTKYRTFRKLGDILDPQLSGEALEQLHKDDLDSTWFGTTSQHCLSMCWWIDSFSQVSPKTWTEHHISPTTIFTPTS